MVTSETEPGTHRVPDPLDLVTRGQVLGTTTKPDIQPQDRMTGEKTAETKGEAATDDFETPARPGVASSAVLTNFRLTFPIENHKVQTAIGRTPHIPSTADVLEDESPYEPVNGTMLIQL